MIYYKEEKKKLVIPSGFVMIPIDCDEAIEQAREDGYREGFADGSSAACDTEEGTYSLTDDFDGEETVFPSEGKTGFNKIVIVDDGYGDAKYDEGYADGIADCSGSTPCDCSSAITEAYQSGVTEGMAEQKALLSSTAITSNGTYTSENGWNSLTVDVPAPPIIRVEKRFNLESGDTSPWTVRPDWATYMTDVIITDNGYGQGKYDEGYTAGQADCSGGTSCNLQDDYELYLDGSETAGQVPIWPNEGYDGISEGRVFYMEAYQNQWNSGHTSGFTDGYQSGYTEGYDDALYERCNLTDVLVVVPSGSSGMISDFMPPSGYTGFYSVSVNATEYGQEMYQSGYTAGQADCSGGTCPTETGLINLDSGWSGYESYQPLGSGYYDEVIITDAGYGQAKFDQGYELGLATCSASSGSCLIEDEQTASLGYDWTGFTIVYPSQGYDGLGRVLVADLGYGQAKYDEGYNDGQASCSAATEEAYESGVTEERGNIYAVRIRVEPTALNWSWTQYGTPHKLTAADASGNNYVFNIQYVVFSGYSWDEDAGQTYIEYEFLGRFETTGGTPVKYLTPTQVTVEVPSQDYNSWGNNIGITVYFNGEMIPNQYIEGDPSIPLGFELENGFKYTATSYSVGYNAVDSRCFQLIINL